jgi:hypothetical protein
VASDGVAFWSVAGTCTLIIMLSAAIVVGVARWPKVTVFRQSCGCGLSFRDRIGVLLKSISSRQPTPGCCLSFFKRQTLMYYVPLFLVRSRD